jgi:hypothetical protein
MITIVLLELQETKGKREGTGGESDYISGYPTLPPKQSARMTYSPDKYP